MLPAAAPDKQKNKNDIFKEISKTADISLVCRDTQQIFHKKLTENFHRNDDKI